MAVSTKALPTSGTATPVAVDGPGYVCVGAIAGAHGIRGDVKVKPFTEDPLDVGAYGPVFTARGISLKLQPVRVQGQALIARIEGVADRNAAEALRGQRLYVPRDALPETDEDEFYHADLLGLPVVDGAGETIGTVRTIQDFGAGDMLEVALATGGTAFLPFTLDVVPTVDLKAGHLIALPPEGWLDVPKAEDGEGTE
ncbi:MAG: ribosome maturation factor RimM [Zavarzinia sp.]|nr:ribosome maturation factor RimM [Zavarzinia sp.]